jgi:hypothetical protein
LLQLSNQILGYTLQSSGTLTIVDKSLDRLKEKLRKISKRNRVRSIDQIITQLTYVAPGRLNFFQHRKCRGLLQEINGRIRRKFRCYQLEQCIFTTTLQRFFEGMGAKECQNRILALLEKGNWRKSDCPQANQTTGNKWFEGRGYTALY